MTDIPLHPGAAAPAGDAPLTIRSARPAVIPLAGLTFTAPLEDRKV